LSWAVNVNRCVRRRAAAAGAALSLVPALVGAGASAASGDRDLGFGGASHGLVEFDLGGNVHLTGLAVQPRGGIVSVGYELGATTDAVVYRLKPDGRPDHGFGKVRLPGPSDATEEAYAAVAQPDGKIVVAGIVTDPDGLDDFAVWRLKPTGRPDRSFGDQGLVALGAAAGTNDGALDVALDPQGRIVVAGSTDAPAGDPGDIAVVRLTPQGAVDTAFNNGLAFYVLNHPGFDAATSVAVQANGKVLVAGSFAGAAGNAVLRLKPGSVSAQAVVDGSFGGGTFGTRSGVADVPGTSDLGVSDVAVLPSGKLLLLDAVRDIGGSVDGAVVRLTRIGAVDPTFAGGSATGRHIDTDAPAYLKALALMPRGGVAVVGANGSRTFVAKLRGNGAPDRGMGPGGVRTLADLAVGPVGTTASISVLPDGRILAVGDGRHAIGQGAAYRLIGDLAKPSCAGTEATITGTDAPDTLVGTRRADVIAGLGGADRITGLGRGDIVCGGPGDDHIAGGSGGDHLYGQAGDDTLSGGPGHDRLVGGTGRDTLRQ
jgi:uncharacterized delta-60 repeat protein